MTLLSILVLAIYFTCVNTQSLSAVYNATLSVGPGSYQSSFQANFYSNATIKLTGEPQLGSSVVLCIQGQFPTPYYQKYLDNIELCQFYYNFTNNENIDIPLRGYIYYFSLYSYKSQKISFIITGEYCLNNQTYNGSHCIIPESDTGKIVTLKPGEKNYYRVTLNTTEVNSPNSYVYYYNISVIPTVFDHNDDLSGPVLKRDLTQNVSSQFSLVGRFYGIPTPLLYDFNTPNTYYSVKFPHTGTWDFYIQNQNINNSFIYYLSWEVGYCNSDTAECHSVSSVPTDLDVISLESNAAYYYIYPSIDSSLLIGATTVDQTPSVSLYIGYNRFPQFNDFDLLNCTELNCGKVNQISVPSLGTPGVWYIVLRNPLAKKLSINLWFNSQCAPLCSIRGNCQSDATCLCIAQMYSGIDCAIITDSFDTYVPLIITGAALFLFLILAGIMYLCCTPMGGYTAIN